MSDSKTEGGSAPSLNGPLTPEEIANKYCDQGWVRPIMAAVVRERDAEWRAAFDSYVLDGTEPMCRHCEGLLRDSLDPRSCEHCKPLRALINEDPRRQAPPDALAQARSEGRAAALEETGALLQEAKEALIAFLNNPSEAARARHVLRQLDEKLLPFARRPE